jgi:hypothetical protein
VLNARSVTRLAISPVIVLRVAVEAVEHVITVARRFIISRYTLFPLIYMIT